MTAAMAMEMADTNNDSQISWDEFWESFTSEDDHDDHDDHDENETHDEDHDDHEDGHTALDEAFEEYMMNTLMEMFNESDVNNDTYLSMDELEHFVEDVNFYG